MSRLKAAESVRMQAKHTQKKEMVGARVRKKMDQLEEYYPCVID